MKEVRKQFDIIIIGGGASGMTAACFCKKELEARSISGSVALLERGAVLGKKLSVTGNGKCNLSNQDLSLSHYNCSDKAFLEGLFEDFGTDSLIAALKPLGIGCISKNGYIYPMSEQAKSVSECLERQVENLDVRVFKETEVSKVSKEGDHFDIFCTSGTESFRFLAKAVILSCGGRSSAYASLTGYSILEAFGHKINSVKPALVALSSKDRVLKKLAGVRLQSEISLLINGKKYKDRGEIIFNDGNISGIPVFQVSRYLPEKPVNVSLEMDLLPSLSKDEAAEFLMNVWENNRNTTAEQLFRGLLNYKAVYYIFENKGIDSEQTFETFDMSKAQRLVDIFKHFRLEITGTKGFENAQTCTGGLDTGETGPDLMSKRVSGLFVTGELLDVDGDCGGYNLHFAFASGRKAGISAAGFLADARSECPGRQG